MAEPAPLPPPLPEPVAAALALTPDGLIPAIAQQHDTGEVLMMAWMNTESLAETLATGTVTYWSRSRARLWRKGESSGQTQRLVDLRLDCDGDTLLLMVDQSGVACHTGRRSCFYRRWVGANRADATADTVSDWVDILPVEIDPATLYGAKTK